MLSGKTKFYFFNPGQFSYFQCHDVCRQYTLHGQVMDMLSFESDAEQKKVNDFIWSGNCPAMRGWEMWTGLNTLDNLLISAPQKIPQGAWKWSATGESMSYSSGWIPGEPNRIPADNLQYESCGTFKSYGGGNGRHGLNDVVCNDRSFGCLCEAVPTLICDSSASTIPTLSPTLPTTIG